MELFNAGLFRKLKSDLGKAPKGASACTWREGSIAHLLCYRRGTPPPRPPLQSKSSNLRELLRGGGEDEYGGNKYPTNNLYILSFI